MALETITTGTYIEAVKPMPKAEVKMQSGQTSSGDSIQAATGIQSPVITVQPAQENPLIIEDQKKEEQAEKQLRNAVSEANQKLKGKRTGCEFTYHEETKRVSIKVFDKETKEVIREIPPEESIEMIEKIWELAGLLVDEKR